MESFGERLQQALGLAKISQSELSRRSGVAQQHISRAIRRRARISHHAREIATVLGVNPGWLATGEGAMQDPNTDARQLVWVPHYDLEAAAGVALPQEDVSELYPLPFRRGWLQKRGLSAEHLAIIRVGGDSMEPMMMDGDLILVDRNDREPTHRHAYVFKMGNDLQVKLWEAVPGGARLVSKNSNYPPYLLSLEELEQMEIIGRVILGIREW